MSIVYFKTVFGLKLHFAPPPLHWRDCEHNFKWPSIYHLQWLPLKSLLFNNVKDIVVFLDLKVINSDNFDMSSCSRNAQFFCCRKPHLIIISFQPFKHWHLTMNTVQCFTWTKSSVPPPFLSILFDRKNLHQKMCNHP